MWVCVMAFLFLVGNGILSILYRREWKEGEFTAADALALGVTAMIGTAEAAHLCMIFAGVSLEVSTALFGGLSAVLLAVSLASVLGKKRRGGGAAAQSQASLAVTWRLQALCFGALVLAQAVLMQVSGNVYLNGDMTVETVGSFLEENGAYLVNPMTGAPYTGGIPLRLELLCLPTLYSVLCRIFQLTPQAVVWGVVPLVVLPCCYCAFSCVGRCLSGQNKARQFFFLLFTAVLLWAGNYRCGLEGFGLWYCGWRGVSIRSLVLVPYLISACLRRKWKLAVLCVMAEACIVWTFYGAGVCLLAAAGLFVCQLAMGRLKGSQGEEAAE